MIICDFLKKSILFVTLGKKMMNALKIWTCIKPWKVGKNWIVVFCFQGYCRARLYLKSYQKDFSLWFLSCTTFRHTPEIMDGCSDKPQKSKSCDFTYLVKYLFYDLLLFTFKKCSISCVISIEIMMRNTSQDAVWMQNKEVGLKQ